MNARDDFEPGDLIVRQYRGSRHSWLVLDPVRTKMGKLRLRSDGGEGAEMTTWWTKGSLQSSYEHIPKADA